MDLFNAIVDESKQHPNFRAVSDPEHFAAEHKLVQEWAEGFVDRDNKFVREFQTTFNSSFWELYLHAAFRELGFETDYSHAAPDFLLNHSGHGSVIAEAVVASHAEGFRPEWERPLHDGALKDFDKDQAVALATIRLSNAIYSKHKKYLDSYQHLPHVERNPFIICVAPFEQPFFFSQNDNAIRRVLYGYDAPIYLNDDRTGERIFFGESRIASALKPNGSSVSQGIFTRPGFNQISAVIFSNTATWTKVRAMAPAGNHPLVLTTVRYNHHGPDHILEQGLRPNVHESLLDGLHVMINPYAENPLPLDLFVRPEIAVHRYDPHAVEYHVDVSHRFLIQHGSMSFFSNQGIRDKFAEIQFEKSQKYEEFSMPPFPPGQLIRCDSASGPFVDNHLAHYRGWTIVVARCSIDNDWGAQAINCIAHTVGQYFNRNPDSELLLPNRWCDSPEEAFELMKKRIDERMHPNSAQRMRRKAKRNRQRLLEQSRKKRKR